MITRRHLIGLGVAVGTAATAAKSFAARLPGLGFAAQVAKPADALKGKIYYKEDSQYEIFRRGATWNAKKPNRYPNAIVLAESDKDVIAAVKLAKERGWQVGTRSGGHSFTGSHTRDNAVLINISKMKELTVDAKARTAIASPAWFGDQLNNVLAKDQLVFPTAHDPGVGIGGFVMCGGHSTVSRLYGPACANLLAADIVTADGELIHADEKQNSDYFWAIRGAGPGFFGVAVRYYLKLHPLPTHRKSSGYQFQADALEDLMTWLGTHENSFPKGLEGILIGGQADGKPVIRMAGNSHGFSEQECDAALDILESCPVVKKAVSKRLKFPFATAGGIKPGSRQVLDGIWTSEKPDKIYAASKEAFLNLPTPQSFMLWLHWGPVQKLQDMAYSIQGDIYMSPNAIYYDEKDDARCAAWSAEVMAKLKPISVGSQMNDENMPANKGPYLSKENAAKLEVLRKKYDPQKRFAGFLS